MSNKDEFTVRVATNVEEACAFVETGFEYVTGEYGDGEDLQKAKMRKTIDLQ